MDRWNRDESMCDSLAEKYYVYNIHRITWQLSNRDFHEARCETLLYFRNCREQKEWNEGSRSISYSDLPTIKFIFFSILPWTRYRFVASVSRWHVLKLRDEFIPFHFSRINEFNDAWMEMNEKFPVLARARACIENGWQVWVEIEKKWYIWIYFELGFLLWSETFVLRDCRLFDYQNLMVGIKKKKKRKKGEKIMFYLYFAIENCMINSLHKIKWN